MDKFKLNFHPIEHSIDAFLPILREEYEELGHGMYCNWDVIKKRFKQDLIMTLIYNERPIGFATWFRNDKVVEMEIIWTIPSERGKGYALNFQNLLTKEFRKRGDVALTLFCATIDGLKLAKRAGFQPQSNKADFSNPNIELGLQASYVKILKNTEPIMLDGDNLYIQCFERFHDDNSFFCEIPLNADFNKKPVYVFIDEGWECKVIYGCNIVRESKLKYILRDLKVPVYNYTVAVFDHNIEIPSNWLKK